MLDPKHFRVRWWILSIFAAAAVLIYTETELRVRYEQKLSTLEYPEKQYIQKNPELIYSGIPNSYGQNSQGYWDNEHSFIKPPNTFRIVIIGDSVAKGYKVKFQENFGRVIEQELNAAVPDKKFEVIILAQGGYSTAQEIFIFKKQAFQYDPDLILWSYCLNDPTHPVFHFTDNPRVLLFYKPRVFLWNYINRQIFYLTETLKARALKCDPEYHKFLHCVYWDDVTANFQTIADLSQQKKVPVILLIHPTFSKRMGDFAYNPFAELDAKLIALAATHQMKTIDVFDAYRSHKLRAITQFMPRSNRIDPWHPSAEGHRVAGEYIAGILEKTFFQP